MVSTVQILVLLLAVTAGVAVLSARLKIPPAIILVLTGVVLALIPGLPEVVLAPELVLMMVLPPLIYSSAVAMSWREFRFNLRPISLLAIGCVVFTTVAVALAAYWLIGLPLARSLPIRGNGRSKRTCSRVGAHAAPRAIAPADGSAAGAATGVCARAGSNAISAAVATAPSRAPRPKKT